MKWTSLLRYARLAFPDVGPHTRLILMPDDRPNWRLVVPSLDGQMGAALLSRPAIDDIPMQKWVAAKRGRRRMFRWGYSKLADTLVAYPTVRYELFISTAWGRHWQPMLDEVIEPAP